jgi:hypothetical protein
MARVCGGRPVQRQALPSRAREGDFPPARPPIFEGGAPAAPVIPVRVSGATMASCQKVAQEFVEGALPVARVGVRMSARGEAGWRAVAESRFPCGQSLRRLF